MRADMSKVIVERPRRGGGFTRKGRALDFEDLPSREGIRRPHGAGWHRKELNENLAPLRRFLRSRIGKHWSKVYAEISAHLRPTNTVQQHVRDHVEDFVAQRTVKRGGQIRVLDGQWRGGGDLALADSFYEFYVHPVSGVLMANRQYRLSQSRARERRRRDAARLAQRRRELDAVTQLHKIDGIWFEVTLAPIPEEGLQRQPPDRAPASPEQHDAVLHTRFTEERALALYGRRGVFARAKRQLARPELQRHGLENDAPDG